MQYNQQEHSESAYFRQGQMV